MKRMRNYSALAAILTLTLAAAALAVVPQTINYQVMLTNDEDQPLANQDVTLWFRIFDAAEEGSLLWMEEHTVATNGIGVASVILGETNPLVIAFDQPLWLEVQVHDQTLMPRRELTAATTARHAHDSELLGGVPAPSYALDDDLYQPGTLNDPSNPLEWTKLKNMPAGFADGVDDAGAGDGYSLDASDGSPTDVVRVDADGRVLLGTGPMDLMHESALHVSASQEERAGHFDAHNPYPYRPAVFARSDSGTAVIANATAGQTWSYPTTPAGVFGSAFGSGNAGHFVAYGSGMGLVSGTEGTGDGIYAVASGTGYAGHFKGGSGVFMEGDHIPLLMVENQSSASGDAAYFSSDPGSNSLTWTINSDCYNGTAGRFVKHADDNEYAVYVLGYGNATEGLFVRGHIYSTSLTARGIDTPRGTEPVFGVSSPDVQITYSGRGRLSGGSARVNFDNTFADAVAGPQELTITMTPVGRWSGLFIASIDERGFEVRSEAGDPDVQFHWTAVGIAKGQARRPEITIPDPEEYERLARAKEAEIEAHRPPKREPPEARIVTDR